MKRRDRLRHHLETAATTPVPAPDPAFVDALEARLVARAAGRDPDANEVALDRPARGRSRVLVAAAAVVLAVFVAGWLLATSSNDATAALRLRTAVATAVVLPDGRVVDGRAGLSLPDGTVVRVGPTGAATVGNVRVGPGEEAVIEGTTVRVRRTPDSAPIEPAPTTTAPPSTTAPTRPPATTVTRPGPTTTTSTSTRGAAARG